MNKGIHVFGTEVTYVSISFAYEVPTLALVQAHTLAERAYFFEVYTLKLCHIFDADNEKHKQILYVYVTAHRFIRGCVLFPNITVS
jgi:hypothetical protein